MAQQDYAVLRTFFDGRAVVNISEISQKTNSGQVPIKVLNYGLVGFVKGAGDITVSGTMFVPAGGFEEPVQTWAVEGSYHTIQIGCGPTDFTGTGKFMDTTVKQSTDQGTSLDFSFMCPPSIFE